MRKEIIRCFSCIPASSSNHPNTEQVGGFDGVPDAGEMFTVVRKEDTARDLAEARRKIARESSAAILQASSITVQKTLVCVQEILAIVPHVIIAAFFFCFFFFVRRRCIR